MGAGQGKEWGCRQTAGSGEKENTWDILVERSPGREWDGLRCHLGSSWASGFR